jgi:hypothetical protein
MVLMRKMHVCADKPARWRNYRQRLLQIVLSGSVSITISTQTAYADPTIEGSWSHLVNGGPTGKVDLQISHVGHTWLIESPSDTTGAYDYRVIDADDRSIAFQESAWMMKFVGGRPTRDYDMRAGWNSVCRLTPADQLACRDTVYGNADGLVGGSSVFVRLP